MSANGYICLFLVLIFIANFSLGSLILSRNKTTRSILFYVLTTFAVSLWTAGITTFYTDRLPLPSITLTQSINAVGALIPLFFLLFSIHFISKENLKIGYLIAATSPALLMIGLIFVPGLFATAITSNDTVRTIVFGPLFKYYAGYNSVYFTVTFLLLLKSYFRSEGINKMQIKYILAGTMVSSVIGLFSNVIMPLVGNFKYVWLGPIGSSVMVGFTTFAIARLRLFNMKMIITQIAVIIFVLGLSSQLILSGSVHSGFLNIVSVVIIAYAGYLYAKSVKTEIQRSKELEKANRQLERDKKELVELDRMKDEFIQMATHELNTPISVIQGRMDMAVREDICHLTKEQRDFFQPILIDTERLSSLSRDILCAVRIDQHRLKINAGVTDLNALISGIVLSLEAKAKERGNSIAYIPMDKNLPGLTIDKSKVGEVITNLIGNAIKFTENGAINVKSEVKGNEVVISVSDTGVGVDKEAQKHLFEKFYQVDRFDPENPQEQQGTGLGLYISENIVELHGGEMWFESEKGRGSTFYFSLPLQGKEAKQKAAVNTSLR